MAEGADLTGADSADEADCWGCAWGIGNCGCILDGCAVCSSASCSWLTEVVEIWREEVGGLGLRCECCRCEG